MNMEELFESMKQDLMEKGWDYVIIKYDVNDPDVNGCFERACDCLIEQGIKIPGIIMD